MAKIEVGECNVTLMADAESTQTAYIFHLAKNAYPLHWLARVKTAFVGLTAPTVELGISGDTERYIIAQPIDKVGELIPGTNFTISPYAREGYCQKLAHERISPDEKDVIATFRVASGDFSGYTAGEMEFLCVYVNPD